MVSLVDPSRSFLSSRPEWTLHGALLKSHDGHAAHLQQEPFLWSDGAWQAELRILPVEPTPGMQSVCGLVRVTPDTLRRWKDVHINPFIEACAQIVEQWRTTGVSEETPTFTLL